MSTTTYILGVTSSGGGQSQQLIPTIANGVLTSTSTSTLPAFSAFTDAQSDWSQANTNALSYIKNKPASATQLSASRSLNSGFQVSTTKNCLASYCVDISCTLSLTTGQSGTVFMEIASDSGFTTNLQEVARFTNANSGALTIGLNLVQTVTGNLNGMIPAAYYCRLRTANNTGAPTFTYRTGQEVLL